MIQIKLIRENPDLVRKNLEKRKDAEKSSWLDDLINKDKDYRNLLAEEESLRHKRNEITLEINQLKKENKDAKDLLAKAKEIPDRIKEVEAKKEELKQKIDYYLMRIPNILHESVPYGKDETGLQ